MLQSHGAGTPRGIYEGDAAERPENDLIRLATSLAAGQRVPKFVKKNNREQG